MKPLLPLMFLTGLNLAFNAGFLSSIITNSFKDDSHKQDE